MESYKSEGWVQEELEELGARSWREGEAEQGSEDHSIAFRPSCSHPAVCREWSPQRTERPLHGSTAGSFGEEKRQEMEEPRTCHNSPRVQISTLANVWLQKTEVEFLYS